MTLVKFQLATSPHRASVSAVRRAAASGLGGSRRMAISRQRLKGVRWAATRSHNDHKGSKKWVCTMCTPGASDSVVPALDSAGFGMFLGEWRFFKGWRPVRVPLRDVFPLFMGFSASERAHFAHLWAPSGAFFIGGRCCGRLPPSILGATGCCSLPVHGR
jgi:hypothetical protein